MKLYPGKMNWSLPLIVTLTLVGAALAPTVEAQTCGDPGDQSPAAPVPECVKTTGSASEIGTDASNPTTGLCPSPGTPGVAFLWPSDFRPAPDISLSRDTTQRIAGTFEPNARNGFELFKSLDVVQDAADRSRLYTAYSLGIQVWDVTDTGPVDNTNFAVNPFRLTYRDGFEGHFAAFPPSGEQLNFIEDIAAMNAGTKDLIAVSGKIEIGISLWDFVPNTASPVLVQKYQDPQTDFIQVRLAEHNGKVYAFAIGASGLQVYDVSAASELTSVCLEESGQCPGIHRGEVPDVGGTAYLDVMEKGGKVYVATSGVGFSLPVEIWEIGEPSVPGNVTTRKVWSGLSPNVAGGRGPAFIDFNGHSYLAVVDSHKLKIVLIDECVDGDITTCDASPPPLVVDFPSNISPNSAIFGAAQEFLTFSKAGGVPFLYYGVALNNLEGTDLEQLWNLSNLPVSGAQAPLSTLPEITDGGGSYPDPCNAGQQIRYWSHYYHKNIQGLRNMHPRIGKFLSGGPSGQAYFYRTAQTILEVHIFGGGVPSISTSLGAGESSPAWMEEPIGFVATGANGCSPTGSWTWTATPQGAAADVTAVQIGSGSQVDFEFRCSSGSRCGDVEYLVEASNSACPGAVQTGTSIEVQDPRPEILDPVTISPAAAGNTYDVGQELVFSAQVLGRSTLQDPIEHSWEIFEAGGGAPIETGMDATLTADTCMESYFARPEEVFFDDFELGDTASWSSVVGELYFGGKTRNRLPVPKVDASLDFIVRLTASNSIGDDISADVPFSLTGSRDVDPNPVLGKSGNQVDADGVDFTLTTNATEIRWEFQDAGGDCVDAGNCAQVCNYYAAGCSVIEGGKSVNFGWREPNAANSTREVKVELGKCGSTPVVLTESVLLEEVPVDVVPVVTGFRIADSAFSSNLCKIDCMQFCGSGSSVQEITCKPNQPIPFEVTTDADNLGFNLDYDFDWDANGTYESMEPTTTVTFSAPRGTYAVPKVKARIGSAVSVTGFELKEGSSIRRAVRIQNF